MEFWEWASAKLRRLHKHAEMTPEAIEAFLDSLEDESLSEDHIEEIVASIRAGAIPHREPEPACSWLGAIISRRIPYVEAAFTRNKAG